MKTLKILSITLGILLTQLGLGAAVQATEQPKNTTLFRCSPVRTGTDKTPWIMAGLIQSTFLNKFYYLVSLPLATRKAGAGEWQHPLMMRQNRQAIVAEPWPSLFLDHEKNKSTQTRIKFKEEVKLSNGIRPTVGMRVTAIRDSRSSNYQCGHKGTITVVCGRTITVKFDHSHKTRCIDHRKFKG